MNEAVRRRAGEPLENDSAAVIAVAVNGEPHDVAAGTTILGLLASLGIATPGTAIAVNERVVRASSHAEHELQAGDHVEIVRAASGG